MTGKRLSILSSWHIGLPPNPPQGLRPLILFIQATVLKHCCHVLRFLMAMLPFATSTTGPWPKARPSKITVVILSLVLSLGDTVLVRQQKRNKLTPFYNLAPYKVVAINSSMVTAARGGLRIVQNSFLQADSACPSVFRASSCAANDISCASVPAGIRASIIGSRIRISAFSFLGPLYGRFLSSTIF